MNVGLKVIAFQPQNSRLQRLHLEKQKDDISFLTSVNWSYAILKRNMTCQYATELT